MVKTPPYQKWGKCGHFMPQFDSHLACFGCRTKCKGQDPLFYEIDVNENENLFPKKMCSKCYITMKHAKVKSESPKISTSVFKGKKEMTDKVTKIFQPHRRISCKASQIYNEQKKPGR